MNKIILILLFIAITLKSNETVESVIQKHNQARGGIEKIAKIQNWIFKSESVNKLMNMSSLATTYYKSNKFKVVLAINKQSSTTAYDGKVLWTIDPKANSNKPTIIPKQAEQNYLAQMSQQRDVITIGPLQDYVLRGAKPSLEKDEFIDGKQYYRIKMTLSDGDISLWLNKLDLMIYRVETFVKVKEKLEKIYIILSDYRKIDGMQLPYKIETFFGKQIFSVVNIKEIKSNPIIDDKVFKFPTSK